MRIPMKKLLPAPLLLAAMLAPGGAAANPVSFKDGWGVMPAYTREWSDLNVNYSVTNRYSLGASLFYREGKDTTATFGVAQYNYLLKRWNEKESQANVYLSGGLGGRTDSDHGDAAAGYGGVEADYETRRIYTLASAETMQSADGVGFSRLRGRAGVAPYLARFESLHTWLVLQVDYMPELKTDTSVTPLVRFFYDNFALEAGVSLKGDPFLAAMAHF